MFLFNFLLKFYLINIIIYMILNRNLSTNNIEVIPPAIQNLSKLEIL